MAPISDDLRALELIYDTVINPGGWRRALDTVAQFAGADAIALVIKGKEADANDLTMMSSVYLDFSRRPSGWYYGAFLSRLQNKDWEFLRARPPHSPTPDVNMGVSAAALDERKDYAFLRKRTGVKRRLGVRLNADAVWFDAMSIGFDRRHEVVPAPAVAKTRLLLPHLTKALEIGRTFAFLKARYRAALAALDNVQAGVVIAMPEGQVICRNAEAERIISLKDGLAIGADGRIATSDPVVTAQVAANIREVGATAKGEADRHEALISISRPSGETPFLLDIAPIRDSRGELDGAIEGVIATIIDPERAPYLRLERFAELYGLTRAETAVCRSIADGASIAEIADRRNTSPATAKNQVAAVLSKTGVNSRVELIRLILRVLPPVA